MFLLSALAGLPAMVAEKAFNLLFGFLVKECTYVIRCRENVDELKKECAGYVSPFQRPITDAMYGIEENDPAAIQTLKEKEEKIKDAADELIKEYNEENGKNQLRFCGSIPNPISRHKYGKEASQRKKAIEELRESKAEGLTKLGKPPGTVIPPITEDDYLPESRAKILNCIIEALQDPKTLKIGVWGGKSMGKSILRKNLVHRALKEKHFDIRAEIKKFDNVQTIQNDIAYSLIVGNFSQKEGDRKRQKAIRTRLMNNEDEKVLIILDGLSKKIDLEDVGITPHASRNVCKVVLLSADRDLLLKEMDVPEVNLFRLPELSDTESIDLFQRTLKKGFTNDQDKKDVMEKLVKECKGLPYVIVEQADKLKNGQALYEWNDALMKIRSENDQILQNHVNNILNPNSDAKKTSSNSNLRELRSLIYVCGLIGESTISVQDLVIHCRAMSFFGGMSTVATTRDRVQNLLKILHQEELLGGTNEYVKIKGEYGRVFTSVRSDRHPCILTRDDGEGSSTRHDRCPEGELGDCTEMSINKVDDSDIEWIKELGYKCPKLEMLLLRSGDCSQVHSPNIPIGCFTNMRKITVLHLTNINFTFSPLSSSADVLVNLKTMRLECCKLKKVEHIGDLKTLQHLSFSGSDIVCLPKDLRKLTDLRLLDLRRCNKLQVIESGALESLTNLEELYLDDSFTNWEVPHQRANPHGGTNNIDLDELKAMNELSTLQFHVPDAAKLPIKLPTEKLNRYRIVVGNIQDFWGNSRDFFGEDYKEERTLKLSLPNPTKGDSDFLSRRWMKRSLEKCYNLYIRGEIKQFHSIQDLSLDGFLYMKRLHVQESPTIECIIKKKSVNFFQDLVSLTLVNLTNLKKICYDKPNSPSFKKLEVLKIQECGALEYLFKLDFVEGTPNLKEIEVIGCTKLKGIIIDEEENKTGHRSGTKSKVEWPNLHNLTLNELDEVISFIFIKRTDDMYSEGTTSNTSSAFFNNKQISLPALKSLTLVQLPRVKEIWSQGIPSANLGNLQKLHVERCESLQSVINDHQLMMLKNLMSLTVSNCPLVKEAFQVESDLPRPPSPRQKSHSQKLFPGLFSCRIGKEEQETAEAKRGNDDIEISSNLVELKLVNLQSLEHMWKSSPRRIARFQNLSQLTVQDCGKLKRLFSVSMARGLLQMRRLIIENCQMLEVIVFGDTDNEEPKLELKKLTFLSLKNLQSLETFSLGIGSISFPSLETLSISKCSKPAAFYDALPPFEHLQVELDNGHVLAREAGNASCVVNQERSNHRVSAILREASPYEEWIKEPALFQQKVLPSFPSLEHLALSEMEIIDIWQGQVCDGSFPKLSKVTVEACKRLSHVFQQDMLKAFLNIETLRITNCSSLERILVVPGPPDGQRTEIENDNAREFFPRLKNLFLKGLEKLEHIWPKKDPYGGIITFGNLEQVSIRECNTLEYLFPASMKEDFSGLKRLKVIMCDGLKQLIQDDPTQANGATAFNFHYLKSLRLQKLKNLKNLYSKQHISRWPELKVLTVVECDKVKIFGSTGHDFSASDQCLFWVDKNSFRELEQLQLYRNQLMREIWRGKLSRESFNELRAFELASPIRKPAEFPLGFLQQSTYLEKLKVSNCQILECQIEQSAGVHEKEERLQKRPRMIHGSEQAPQSHTVVFPEVKLNMVTGTQYLHEGLRLMGVSADYFHG